MSIKKDNSDRPFKRRGTSKKNTTLNELPTVEKVCNIPLVIHVNVPNCFYGKPNRVWG